MGCSAGSRPMYKEAYPNGYLSNCIKRCEYHGDCLSCPFPKCKDEVPVRVFRMWLEESKASSERVV